jgi:ABC-type multidrug transport system ATPase subunit
MFYLPDFPPVHPFQSVIDHISVVLKLYGKDGDSLAVDRIFAILQDLDLVGLARAPLVHLSRGQLYKAALAALMAVEPDLLLLDEPFASGMDPHGIYVFRQWARRQAEGGRIVLYSTQILEVAEGFADRVAILHAGRLRSFESVSELRSRAGDAREGVLASLLEQLREPS